MRFLINTPNEGDRKKVKRFAFIPIKVGQYWIWLEYYVVEYLWANYWHKASTNLYEREPKKSTACADANEYR